VALFAAADPAKAPVFEIFSRLVLAVIGMVLVEQLYRNVAPQQRWMIKFLCLGLGAMFVCDFYLYSDALLFRRINDDIWVARGFVDALIVPVLAIATARNPRWSVDISVSRGIVFHSAAVLGCAVYLLVMAAAGYYVRYFGGNWGAVLQIAFVFAALQLLFMMLFSGALRARLQVFLSKNFFSHRYDYREEWLRFTSLLSEGEPGQLRERSIQAIADLVHSPGGALWLLHEGAGYEHAASWNIPVSAVTEPADSAFCGFLEKRQWVVDLEEYDERPAAYEALALPDWLRAIPRAWLVVPLILHERMLGFVVLQRSKAKINVNWEVRDLLKTGGRQAASYLAQLEANSALLVARQFESFNRMSAFVVHDLKNLVAQLSLVMSNSGKHKHNPQFQDDMIETVAHSVDKMKRLLFQLRGYSIEPPAAVSLNEVLKEAIGAKSASSPVPRYEDDGAALSIVAHRSRLERILGHLIQNAVEATPPQGEVRVRLAPQGGAAIITISDSGCGMSEQFRRSRLFKPFESTKPAGMGIGTYEAHQYVRELGGRIEVESREGVGSTFRVMLPNASSDPAQALRYATEDSR
jgi:putative PEP-CTERM system histidine kinase